MRNCCADGWAARCGGAAVLGVQYAPLIGIFAFVAESIPVLGPIIATVPAVLIAVVESPWKALAVLAWFIVVQQLETERDHAAHLGACGGHPPRRGDHGGVDRFQPRRSVGRTLRLPLLGFAYALVREVYRVYVTAPTAAHTGSDAPMGVTVE